MIHDNKQNNTLERDVIRILFMTLMDGSFSYNLKYFVFNDLLLFVE